MILHLKCKYDMKAFGHSKEKDCAIPQHSGLLECATWKRKKGVVLHIVDECE